jgi:glycosyltransferase involved in cell wall biosynthesis
MHLMKDVPGDRTVDSVLIVAPLPPPYGGMGLQALLLQRMLLHDGVSAEVLGYNQAFAPRFQFLTRIPAVRTFLRAVSFVLRFCGRAGKVDVVHVLACSWLYFFLIVSPAVLIGRLRGKRVVLNYRGGDADVFLERFGWMVKPIFKLATLLTAPSGFLAQVIRKRLGLPVAIVPNIVDFSKFRYRRRESFQPKMIVTRHLEALYDVETVLRAFQKIQENYPLASLVIAGTGSQEGQLREMVSNSDLKNVRFLGYVDHQRLPAVYDECDILLNASRVDNFPGSLMEASAAGLAVVSTNAGGIPFLYENGKNALLAEIGDWERLALDAQRILSEPDLGLQLSTRAAELCRQCDWANVRRCLYAAYGFALRERADAAATAPAASAVRTT